MVFWNPKKRRTTAKPKTTASISKPKVGSVKQELNILPQPKKTDNPKPNKVPKNEDVKKQFLKTFNQLTYRHRSWDVWRDFIIMFACSLSNPVDKFHYEEREKRYLKIIKKYNKREQEQFPELAAYVVMALEENPEQDFLGSIFMELLQFQIRQPDLCSSQPVLKQITYCAKVAFAKLNAPSGDTYTPDR